MNPLLTAMLAAFSIGNFQTYNKHQIDFGLQRRGRSKKGGGKGGAGVTLRKQFRTRPPAGYWQQVTPLEHMHSAARLRSIAASAA